MSNPTLAGVTGFTHTTSALVAQHPLTRNGTRRFVLAFGEQMAYIRVQDAWNPWHFLRQMEGNPPTAWGTSGFKAGLMDDRNPARHYAAFVFVGFWLPGWIAALLLWLWELAGYLRYGLRWSQTDTRSGYVGPVARTAGARLRAHDSAQPHCQRFGRDGAGMESVVGEWGESGKKRETRNVKPALVE